MAARRSVSFLSRSSLSPSIRRQSGQASNYQSIIYSNPSPTVGVLTLNRPKALNALSSPLFTEINELLSSINSPSSSVRCLVITGSEKSFAAGADITEMADRSLAEVFDSDFLKFWSEKISSFRVPIVAAVSGYALGGGCELAMMCDIILASKDAKFGQPEINASVIPGAGGTQRLVRAIGKSKAMEYVLTGKPFSAQQAYEWGLISRVVEGGHEELLKESLALADSISTKPKLATKAAKEAVNLAYELPLSQGLDFEKRLFHLLFGTEDQKEGMKAFVEKRKPKFTHS
ncbi:enoyl-CoA hydratase [Puccinia sorghi]|uniref:Probable enoyl-CoA hydratase, mitochondrial n=1 Tax=Puccinia sorghi TaxID=27349 RepID=A0A0L6U8H1_9BASI|nr:enoyl-CoA hydratase [Puccinia sorghi]